MLHPFTVSAPVNAQVAARQGLLHAPRRPHILRGDDDGRWIAARHFGRETRSREDGGAESRLLARLLAEDLGEAEETSLFDSLRGDDEIGVRRQIRRGVAEDRTAELRRHDKQDQ